MTQQDSITTPNSTDSTTQRHFLLRLFVSILYILATIGILWIAAKLMTSPACYQDNRCDKYDQIYFAVMGLADFILAYVWVIFGMKGKLPGAKKRG
ncbi:MAG: hypothetical protein MJK04_17625 [Psychrosphaera sp.]|nr:hypothetical protein [Psychrosphaera sp.]